MFNKLLLIDWKNKSIKNIIKGWYRYILTFIFPNSSNKFHIEQQKSLRKFICSNCPMNKDNWCNPEIIELDIYDNEVRGCGCYLPAKWEVGEEQCPRLLWDKFLKEEDWQNHIEEITLYYLNNKYNSEENENK